ncbi:hypothetical protein BDFG_03778 [Blastomyces dermatitidis ATCC 26199]|nr:hypothetical protein BDFG_03778 [Blastomyces dermatitidis ATCC 26199]
MARIDWQESHPGDKEKLIKSLVLQTWSSCNDSDSKVVGNLRASARHRNSAFPGSSCFWSMSNLYVSNLLAPKTKG